MPGGRPRKTTHPGGRPVVYRTEEGRKAARKASRDRWYFDPGVHEHVKKRMRERYKDQGDVREARIQEVSIVRDAVISQEDPHGTLLPALETARKVQKHFAAYIQSGENQFLQETVRLVMKDYTPGETSPLLDRIQDDLTEMETRIQACLNELLNSVGAWANEYYEVQRIYDDIKWILRKVTDIHCSAMEGSLEDTVTKKKLAFLK